MLDTGSAVRNSVSAITSQQGHIRALGRPCRKHGRLTCAAAKREAAASGGSDAAQEEGPNPFDTGSGEPLMLDEYEQFDYDQRVEGSHIEENGTLWGEYTPFSFVEYSEDPEATCTHELKVVVDATKLDCYDFLSSWVNLPYCLDLIDTIAPDGLDDSIALIMLFYRWPGTPPLQLMTVARRHTDPDQNFVLYESEEGMPFKAMAELEALEEGQTQVTISLVHPTPAQVVEFVGVFAFNAHVREILQENIQVFKLMVEKKLDVDGLEAYYAEHRADSFDGPGTSQTDLFDNLPEGTKLKLHDELDEDAEADLDHYVDMRMTMEALVAKGDYVKTDEGFARADLTDEEVAEAEAMTRFVRYFNGAEIQDESLKEQLETFNTTLDRLATPSARTMRDQEPDECDSVKEGVDAAAEEDADGDAEETEDFGDDYDTFMDEQLESQFDGVTVVDEDAKEIAQLPIFTRDDVEDMTPEESEEVVDFVAEVTGDKEALDTAKDEMMLSEKAEDSFVEFLDEFNAATSAEAEAQDLTQAEWIAKMDAKADEVLFEEPVKEFAKQVSMNPDIYKSALQNFECDTLAASLENEMPQEQYIAHVMNALDRTKAEWDEVADARGVPRDAVMGLMARIEDGKEEKAEAMGLTEDEYEEYAWAVVREALSRKPE